MMPKLMVDDNAWRPAAGAAVQGLVANAGRRSDGVTECLHEARRLDSEANETVKPAKEK